MISASILGIISQRLVRRICPQCALQYEAGSIEHTLLEIPKETIVLLKKGQGCPYCNKSGYKGRIAIFEIMPITGGHRQLIERRATADELRNYAIAQGMTTLKQAATRLVLEGVTTVDELLRVTYCE